MPARKPAWPLFLVAVLSFIPFLGIVFGAAGATWGLISTRHRAMWAALIAMTGALLNMVMIVVLTAAGTGKRDVAAEAKFTQQEMLRVVLAIEDYHVTEHAYPPSLHELQRRMMLRHVVPVLDMSGTGFHFPHEYRYILAPDGESYDLIATGPDNVIGTADDIRPALPDSIQSRSGFRPSTAGARP